METCMYGSGAGTEKPTAERQKGTLYRAYTISSAQLPKTKSKPQAHIVNLRDIIFC